MTGQNGSKWNPKKREVYSFCGNYRSCGYQRSWGRKLAKSCQCQDGKTEEVPTQRTRNNVTVTQNQILISFFHEHVSKSFLQSRSHESIIRIKVPDSKELTYIPICWGSYKNDRGYFMEFECTRYSCPYNQFKSQLFCLPMASNVCNLERWFFSIIKVLSVKIGQDPIVIIKLK